MSSSVWIEDARDVLHPHVRHAFVCCSSIPQTWETADGTGIEGGGREPDSQGLDGYVLASTDMDSSKNRVRFCTSGAYALGAAASSLSNRPRAAAKQE